MGKFSSLSSNNRHTPYTSVAYDKPLRTVPALRDAAGDVTHHVSLAPDGLATVWRVVAAKAGATRIELNNVPRNATDLALVDAKDSAWQPRTLELRADLPPADLDDATAFCVGRPCKDGGRVVRTGPGGRVWVARAGSLALVDLGQVVLPHSVHAEFDEPIGAAAQLALSYRLPIGSITATPSYDVELDRSDSHATLRGQWALCSSLDAALAGARVSLDCAPAQSVPRAPRSKLSSVFGAPKKRHAKLKQRASESSESDDDEEDETAGGEGRVRFMIPGLHTLGFETQILVPFASQKASCVVRNAVDLSRASIKDDHAATHRANAQFRVEFLASAEKLGNALPPGIAKFYRGPHKHEPRRSIDAFGELAVPLTILPHYLTLGIDLNGVHVSRTAHPLARVGDAERGEQRIELTIRNEQLRRGCVLHIIDKLAAETDAPKSIDGSSVVTRSNGDQEEHDVQFPAVMHEHIKNALVTSVTFDSTNESVKLHYTLSYAPPSEPAAPAVVDDEEQTPRGSSSSSSSVVSNNNSKVRKQTRQPKKVKKSSWW